jgi:hypothetical protein
MTTALLIVFLFVALFFIHASEDTIKATGVVVGIVVGLILLGIYYPVGIAYLLGAVLLSGTALWVYDIGRKVPRAWRLFVRWFDWLWHHPMDNSTGPPLEPERPRTYTDDELKRAMDATIEAHSAKQRVRRE